MRTVFITTGLRGLDEDLAALDAQARAQGIDPSTIRGGTAAAIRTPAAGASMDPSSLLGSGGALDFVKGIFNQGAGASTSFNQTIASMSAADTAREKARTWKLLGGGLFAVGVLGFGLWGVSKLGKR